jgi:uncharacterized DUF497 family protein
MDIDFDPAKRQRTLNARGVDMARAGEVLAGPTFSVIDERFEYGEERWITMGLLDTRMVVVVWTWRGGRHRIISLRKANERERADHEGRLG